MRRFQAVITDAHYKYLSKKAHSRSEKVMGRVGMSEVLREIIDKDMKFDAVKLDGEKLAKTGVKIDVGTKERDV